MNDDTSWSGKCSSFGGPNDEGLGSQEGLSCIEDSDRSEWWFDRIFLPLTSSAFGRNLNPRSFYIAMRFGYGSFQGVQGEILPGYSRDRVRRGIFVLSKTLGGPAIFAQAADWGPNTDTGRLVDCSPAILAALNASTDDVLNVSFLEA